jgi:hypothetical protein
MVAAWTRTTRPADKDKLKLFTWESDKAKSTDEIATLRQKLAAAEARIQEMGQHLPKDS